MTGPPNPLAVALWSTTAGLLALAVAAWLQRDRTRAARSFTFLALAAAVWALAEGARASAVDAFVRLTWLQVEVLGVAALPVALLVFANDYARRTERLDRHAVAMLLVLPALSLGLAWTYPLQNAFWTSVDALGARLVASPGPWWWAHAAYGYALAVAATAVLVGAWRRARRRFRTPTAWVLAGVVVAWVAHGASLAIGERLPIDPTPLAFAFAGVAAAVGLLAHRVHDVVPVARETVLGQLPDPVLVLDPWQRVLRANGAAATLLGAEHAEDLLGRSAVELFHDQPALLRAVGVEASVELEVRWGRDPAELHYRARITPLADRRGRHGGQLLYLEDVDHEVRAERERRATERRYEDQRAHVLALQHVVQALAAGSSEEDLAEALVHRAGEALGAPHAALYRVGPEGDALARVAATGGFAEAPDVRVRRGEDLVGRAWLEGRPVVTEDYPAWSGRALGHEVGWARAALAVPCRGSDGVLGVLALARPSEDRRPFSGADEALATALARLAAIAAEGVGRVGEVARGRLEVAALDEALAPLRLAGPLPEVLERTLAAARAATGLGRAVVWSPTADGAGLRAIATLGLGPAAVAAAAEPVALDGTVPVLEAAFLAGEEVALDPTEPVPERWRLRGPAAASRLLRSRAPVALPLVARGRTVGVLAVDDPYERAPLARALPKLRRFATLAALAVDRDAGVATGTAAASGTAAGEELAPATVQVAPATVQVAPATVQVARERREPVDLADVARAAAGRARARFAHRPEVALDLDLPAGLAPVLGDPERLERVVAHLLARALATTPTGSVALTLARDHDPVLGEALTLRVRDTGTGDDAAALAALFEGSGAFPACRRAVERHGGRLWVRSAPGAGATVGVVLPAADAFAAAASGAAARAAAPAGGAAPATADVGATAAAAAPVDRW